MPTLLTARKLTKSYPSKNLFEDVSVQIDDGDRIGLIGPNGSGKSTLMKILAGVLPPDTGELTKSRTLRAAYVDQDDHFEDGAPPLAVVCDALTNSAHPEADAVTRASIALSKLGVDNPKQDVATVSGGWRKRRSLARALAREPQVLMLDEPTTHLDLEGV